MNKVSFMVILLAGICVWSALAVVRTKHVSRAIYRELSDYDSVIGALHVQWNRLQIEESAFSEHGLVERIASDRLNMSFPGLEGSVMIHR